MAFDKIREKLFSAVEGKKSVDEVVDPTVEEAKLCAFVKGRVEDEVFCGSD